MQKSYSRINWENYPSISTPLNETNLNKVDVALNTVDDRVISLDSTKTDVTTSNTLIKDISMDSSTGIFTITKLNGSSYTIDTLLEKIAVNFDYDATTQKLIITLDDGTTKEIDLSALITEYDFQNSTTIGFTVTSGVVSANVVDGSITESKLRPDYLADIKVQASNAKASEDNAKASEIEASASATNAANSATEAQRIIDDATIPADLEYANDTMYMIDADGNQIGDGAHIETGSGVVDITYAEYMAMPESERLASENIYRVSGKSERVTASDVTYSGTVDATSVSGALDKLNTGIAANSSDISTLNQNITSKQPMLKYVDYTIPTVTISSLAVKSVSSYKPTEYAHPLLYSVVGWDNSTAKGAISITCDGIFVCGTPNETITNLKIRMYYYD